MIPLPHDVKEWLREVFSNANTAAASKLTLIPNSHEPWMDFAVIESLQRVSVPFVFKSEWTVSIDTHWLGSAPLWRNWEIADIGLLVIFRTATKLVRSKVALLQSKRLYAIQHAPDTAREMELYYGRGFGRMLTDDDKFQEMTKPKLSNLPKNPNTLLLQKAANSGLLSKNTKKIRKSPSTTYFTTR